MANGLRELGGLGRGDVIMVMMGNKPELFISFLAIMKIGGGTISPATTLLTPSDVEDRPRGKHKGHNSGFHRSR